MCLTVLFDSLSPGPLWSFSCSWAPTSYSMCFFTQSSSSFRSTCTYCSACSAVISMLCHLYVISLWAPYLEICLSFILHIHLTILISARWSATSFSFLTGQVSLPCNILPYECTLWISTKWERHSVTVGRKTDLNWKLYISNKMI